MRSMQLWRRPRMPGGRYRLSWVYALIAALLLLAVFLLLYPVRHVEGFGTELRINIGSNLFDLVLAALVLQPLVVSLNRNAVRWRNRLDYRDVIRRIEKAEDRVDIWKYWTGLLEPQHEEAFLAAVRTALARGVHFRIMLTDPSSPDAAERARQVRPTDALALMRQNIERLDDLVRTLPAEQFQVMVSSVGPAHAFYRVDDWLTYGLFRDRRVSENHQREVRVHGDLGGLALEAFDNRWTGAGLRAIADHQRIRLRLATGDTRNLRYVTHEGDHWVDADHTDLRGQQVTVPGDGAARYILEDANRETLERVAALYAAKYGVEGGTTLLRLADA